MRALFLDLPVASTPPTALAHGERPVRLFGVLSAIETKPKFRFETRQGSSGR